MTYRNLPAPPESERYAIKHHSTPLRAVLYNGDHEYQPQAHFNTFPVEARAADEPAMRSSIASYEGLLADVVDVIVDARCAAARMVNAAMTPTYWFVGGRDH